MKEVRVEIDDYKTHKKGQKKTAGQNKTMSYKNI